MNICIITSSFPSGPDDVAQAPFLIDFIEELKKRGHRIFVFTQDRKDRKEEFLRDVKVKFFPWSRSNKPVGQLKPFSPLDFLKILSLLLNGRRELSPFLKENKIEACLALWALPGGYFGNHAYRQTRVPYSVWSLGSDIYRYGENPFLYSLIRRIIREARGVFADGFDLCRKVEERFGRKCLFLATTRSLGVREPEKQDTPEKRGGPYRFLFVGRIEKVKGIDLLLQSIACLKEERVDAHLTVVGRGGMEEWAKAFIEQKGLGRSVSWMGSVSDQMLAAVYQSSDCVVIPSRSESIPLVFSEAIRFDKELIVTDVGDMGTLGRQHEVAWVVPPENIIALKESMKKRVAQKNDGNEERDRVKREELKRLFDIETSVEGFLADYR